MSKNWYPVIDNENCIECGACFEKCSHGVYKLEGTKPVVVYTEGCVEGCKGCGNLCPAEAIKYAGDTQDIKEEKVGSCNCGGCC